MSSKTSKQRKKFRLRKYLVNIFAICVLIFMCYYAFVLHEAARADADVSTDKAPFELTMLDVGQGLSILIEADGEYMLYDGGSRDSSDYVAAYLKEQDVKRFKYIIASHHDEDHISGLVGVLGVFPVDTVLSADYDAGTGIYRSFMRKVAASGAKDVRPAAGDIFTLGSAGFEVLSPASYDNEYENNNSIVIRICYGDYSCIITGDAEYTAEREMLESGYTLASDLYVVGHHGSASSSSYYFVQAVAPDYALISVGAGNDYGHPAERTLDTLDDVGARLFRTDKQGDIIFRTDGKSCWFNVPPCEDWSAGA